MVYLPSNKAARAILSELNMCVCIYTNIGGAKVQVTGHRSGQGLQATGQVTGQVTGHRSQATDQVTGHKKQ